MFKLFGARQVLILLLAIAFASIATATGQGYYHIKQKQQGGLVSDLEERNRELEMEVTSLRKLLATISTVQQHRQPQPKHHQHLQQQNHRQPAGRKLSGFKGTIALGPIGETSAIIVVPPSNSNDKKASAKCVSWTPTKLTQFQTENNTASVTWAMVLEPQHHAYQTCEEPVDKNNKNTDVVIRNLAKATNYVVYCIDTTPDRNAPYYKDMVTVQGPLSVATSAGPTITKVQGCPADTATSTGDCVTQGGTNITITGSQFLVDPTDTTKCHTATVGSGTCVPQTCSNTQITCLTPEGDGGQVVTVSVSQAALAGGLRYHKPVISSVTGANCTSSGNTFEQCDRTNARITINGLNFGRPTATVLVAGKTCNSVNHISHFKVECTLANATELYNRQSLVIIPSSVVLSDPTFIRFKPCALGKQPIAAEPQYCEDCPKGYYRGNFTVVSCTLCNGMVRNNGQTCQQCPPDSTKQLGSDTCRCNDGFYFVDPVYFDSINATYTKTAKETADLNKCVECPLNFVCGGDKNIANIKPKPGYFAGANKSIAYFCPNVDACASDGCAAKYAGTLCANCATGYSRDRGFVCNNCPSSSSMAGSTLGLVLITLAVIAWLVWANTAAALKDTLVHSVILKILLTAMQINSIITQVDFKWPEFLLDVAEWQESVTSSAASMNFGCFLMGVEGSFLYTCAFYAFLPVMVCLILTPLWLLLKVIFRMKGWNLETKHLFLAYTIGITLVYLPVVIQTLSMFACRTVEGKLYLLGDVDVICYSSRHAKWLFGVALPSLAGNVIGYPVALGFFYKKWKEGLKEKEQDKLVKMAYVVKGYRHEKMYWEIVVIARKVLVAWISAYFQHVQMQFCLLLVVITCAIALQAHHNPYVNLTLNNLEMYSLGLSWLLFMGGNLLFLSSVPGGWKNAITIFMVSFIFITLILFAALIVKNYYQAKKGLISKLIKRIGTIKKTKGGTTVEEEEEEAFNRGSKEFLAESSINKDKKPLKSIPSAKRLAAAADVLRDKRPSKSEPPPVPPTRPSKRVPDVSIQ